MSLGLLGGGRLGLYRANLDRLFNPKDDLSLAFFKKFTIGTNTRGTKLLYKSCFIIVKLKDFKNS